MQAGQITAMEALSRGEVPMRKFMAHYVREKDVALFIELAKEPRPARRTISPCACLLPAYILSELKAGFQIGTVLVSSVSDCRYGRGFDHHLGRHVAVAAGGDLNAAQAASLPDGRWMASVDRFSDEEFSADAMDVDQVVLLGRLMLQEVIILAGPILVVAISSAWLSTSFRH